MLAAEPVMPAVLVVLVEENMPAVIAPAVMTGMAVAVLFATAHTSIPAPARANSPLAKAVAANIRLAQKLAQ